MYYDNEKVVGGSVAIGTFHKLSSFVVFGGCITQLVIIKFKEEKS